ncbi:Pycsar system effector family protein [Ensifer soli]|uniref:Pycsar system effector family protein n=1 Tax=Ciceribacter sp. sgz301302 TaxID=3342379 RepID=UPI0035BB6487
MSDFDLSSPELAETGASDGDIDRDYFDHVRKINDIFYDQVKISDQKAAYIFTFILAFLISSEDVRGVFTWQRYTDGDVGAILCSLALGASAVYSLLCAIIVVLPRRFPTSTSLFWGTWTRHRDILKAAAERRDPAYLFNEYLQNADTLAAISRAKYRFVTLAFRGLIVTVLAYVALLVAV